MLSTVDASERAWYSGAAVDHAIVDIRRTVLSWLPGTHAFSGSLRALGALCIKYTLPTTSAVITEAMHFVAPSPEGPRSLAELVARSGMAVYDLTQPPELFQATALMERYADIPMDLADATLVLLAEGPDVSDVLTLDRRRFSTYRTRDGRPLRYVLDLA